MVLDVELDGDDAFDELDDGVLYECTAWLTGAA